MIVRSWITRLAWLAIAIACVLAAPASARADEPVIGVVADAESEPIARRLAAELRGRGYRVRDIALPIETFSDLGGLHATAWVDVARVRICVAGSQRPCEELSDTDTTVLLIRAVEALRAQLDDPAMRALREAIAEPEATAAEPPEPDDAERPPDHEAAEPEPPEAPAPAVPSPSQWQIAITASAVLPSSSLSFGVAGGLAVSFAPDPWLSLELGGLATLLDPAISEAGGAVDADARVAWLLVGLRIPERVLAGHHLVVGAGPGIASIDLHATATPPFEARSSSLVTALIAASVAMAIHIVDRVSLWVAVRAGASLPQPVIVIAEREGGRWGAPFATIDLGVAVAL